MKIQRTPQDKKQLSYERECRNCYGESHKGSVKSIRFRKSWVNQTYRQMIRQRLKETIEIINMIPITQIWYKRSET